MTDCRSRRDVLAPLQKASVEGNKGRKAVRDFTNPLFSSASRESFLAKPSEIRVSFCLGLSPY
jgi:hypothetical protein